MSKDRQLKVRVELKDLVKIKENAKAEGYKTVGEFVRAKTAYDPPTKKYNPSIGF